MCIKTFIRKLFLSICFCAICIISNAQTIIQMEEYGGVYRIPCKVNGAKMKLIFDTGAENVCLSLPMAEYLFDNDFISSADIIGSGSSTVADGRIVDHVELIIKDIEIEGIHLYNVRAVVIEGQNAPLLMGQSAIQKLGPVEINGSILTIKNGEVNSDVVVDRLFDEAIQAYDNKMYGRATEKYAQLYAMNQLSDYDIYLYAKSCWFNNDSRKANELLSQIDDYSYFEEKKIDIYRLLGYVNDDLEKYREAANYYHLSNTKIQTEKEEWFSNMIFEADCYCKLKNYSTACDLYYRAIEIYGSIHNVDASYLQNDSANKLKKNQKSYRSDEIDYVFFQLYCCLQKAGELSSKDFLFAIAALARAGNSHAMQYCNNLALDPYDDLWR